MQFRLPVAIFVFIGSYLPLSLILLAQDFDYLQLSKSICWSWIRSDPTCILPFQNTMLSIGSFIVCAVCFLFTLLTLWLVPLKRRMTVVEARYIPTDLMNYTLPYVVSFMGIGYNETGKFVGLIIFLGWMFWISYKSGQIILNPLLIAFGWRLYELSFRYAGAEKQHSGLGLSRERVMPGDSYRYASVQDVFVLGKVDKGE